jgi:SAM-dependent methyltransferase
MPAITIPEKLIDSIASSMLKFSLEIRHCDPRTAANDLAAGYEGALNFIEPHLGSYSRPKILEIGSGNGFGLCHMLKSGLDVIGVEPGSGVSFEGRFETALDLLEANGITPAGSYLISAYAEDLPFENDTFDIVFSIAVLEHVRDVNAVMREAMRVVKPTGIVVMNVPNYNSFYEGHYNIMWLPYILASKKIAKWYVRTIFGRHDYYIDELNFTTSRYLRQVTEELPECKTFKTYYSCVRPFDKISAVYYYLSLGLTRSHWMFKFLGQRSLLNGPILLLTGFLSRLLGWIGLAPVFNVVCFKNSEIDLAATK